MSHMVLMQGIPGSGKSTIARQIALIRRLVVCSTDDYHYEGPRYVFKPERAAFYHGCNQDRANFFLSRGVGVVIDNTNLTNRAVRPYYEMADRWRVGVEVIRVAGGYENIHAVPPETLERMQAAMEELSREKALAAEPLLDAIHYLETPNDPRILDHALAVARGVPAIGHSG